MGFVTSRSSTQVPPFGAAGSSRRLVTPLQVVGEANVEPIGSGATHANEAWRHLLAFLRSLAPAGGYSRRQEALALLQDRKLEWRELADVTAIWGHFLLELLHVALHRMQRAAKVDGQRSGFLAEALVNEMLEGVLNARDAVLHVHRPVGGGLAYRSMRYMQARLHCIHI